MTRKFSENSLERAFQMLDELERRIDRITSNHEKTLPFREATNLPPGVEGQIVIAKYFTPGTGVGDGTFSMSWTHFGTNENAGPGTFSEGITAGKWLTLDGAQMRCQLNGTYSVVISGTAHHTGVDALVHINPYIGDASDSSTWVSIGSVYLFSATMHNGDTSSFGRTVSIPATVGQDIFFIHSHGGTAGVATTTATGTITIT